MLGEQTYNGWLIGKRQASDALIDLSQQRSNDFGLDVDLGINVSTLVIDYAPDD